MKIFMKMTQTFIQSVKGLQEILMNDAGIPKSLTKT